ncbi:GNAT family N-acetyltransferase [Saccharopolyspora sp. TS4A08]|uniref:GNAT family N-acetyltransferase n=1 Tax=Saccharopolyspora ipomoeae TaxID=3042027 RepID=A0ABT6PI48_9PSEU|nr:GNAT family N-acetyltransferase [Saccharopolyspora sp. TS4A08]MDI2027644.1 GNAT family N-acetyltransferase [Saccharopolyspora sp. TS4A08]
MPELLTPTARLHTAWLDAHAEWGPGAHEDGFGLLPSDVVASAAGFAAWVERLSQESDRGVCSYRWIVEDQQVLGGIALRHGDDDLVRSVGHIGYGIRPSARRRGLATWALRGMLDEARGLGMDRVLLVCAEDNAASRRTIERNAGVLESVQETALGPAHHYWINLR